MKQIYIVLEYKDTRSVISILNPTPDMENVIYKLTLAFGQFISDTFKTRIVKEIGEKYVDSKC